ncbi:alcohol dehydrogenase catalytic domain-containing protein [Latilactobacillus fuchuensis]|uniref:alcohol dehydrogenase catalytic domain-containing protein n=1 Tax=Latilactobacillus fuchuensis TaxID=164393 RepID=UPI0020C7852B|nr:zinc-binding dehydrogenase [Latilactobacillus fuchuensis]MCP8857233.1 zinc-binding dehydrogenase [Latilactobacillus fuchuensis]
MTINHQITLDADLNWQLTSGTIPTPAADELLIKVLATSLNPVDLKRRTVTKTVLGYDGYGEIIACGTAVTDWHAGQLVYYAGTTQKDGSFQDYQVVTAAICALAPTGLTVSETAGLPLVSLTAYELLFEQFHFPAQANANLGKKLLIINGAGGVGSIMSQLAKWTGFEVYATSSPSHFDWLTSNGVGFPIDYHNDCSHKTLADYPDQTFDAIAVLYDMTDYLPEITRLIKPFGQVGSIVGTAEPLALTLLKAKSISFAWEYMFTKTDYNYQVASQGQILQQIANLITAGTLHPITTQDYQGLTVATFDAIAAELTTGHLPGKKVIVY